DADPGRGELDRQGDSVEPPADVGDDGGLIGRGCKAWAGLARAFDEEPNGGVAVQRRHSPRRFTRPAEWFPARGQEVGAWTSFEERLGEAGACADHVLAVVEDEEGLEVANVLAERGENRAALLLSEAEDPGDHRRDALRIGDRCELDEPDSVGIPLHDLLGHLEREASLAAPPGPREGDKPAPTDGLLELRHLALASDE